MRLESFESRRVAVLGYGQEGRSAARLLSRRGRPAVLDVFTGTAPIPGEGMPGASFHTGLPEAARLSDYDVLVRSPGISPYRPPLSDLPPGGPQVTSGTDIWFSEHPDAFSVVITGSKGKSTTASLTAYLLEKSGLRVALGGNIGVPLLDLMDPEPRPDVWVMELSSYQIHGLRARPNVAVVLNLFPEHLDWHGTAERYFADKLSILDGLGDGRAILNHADEELRRRCSSMANAEWYNEPARIHWDDDCVLKGSRMLFPLRSFPLPGDHNRSNLCAALTVLEVAKRDPASAGEWLAGFHPLPHRLCPLGTRQGIEFVDDSISTTPNATIAALECYADRPVTVLVGGFDRGLDWDGFAGFMAGRRDCRIICFGALGPRVAAILRDRGLSDATVESETLEKAVDSALSVTPGGGVVLLSPGAPSFDAFADYRERGRAFAARAGFRPEPQERG